MPSPTLGTVKTGIYKPNKEYLFSNAISTNKYLNQILLSYANKIETSLYNYKFGICLGDSEDWNDYISIEYFKRYIHNNRIHEKTNTYDGLTFTAENGKWFPKSKINLYTKDLDGNFIDYYYPYKLNRNKGIITFDNHKSDNFFISVVSPKKFRVGIEISTFDAISAPLNDLSILFNQK